MRADFVFAAAPAERVIPAPAHRLSSVPLSNKAPGLFLATPRRQHGRFLITSAKRLWASFAAQECDLPVDSKDELNSAIEHMPAEDGPHAVDFPADAQQSVCPTVPAGKDRHEMQCIAPIGNMICGRAGAPRSKPMCQQMGGQGVQTPAEGQ
jgi:hypothetical protein